MIYEYAIEPEVVAGWADKKEYRYFYDKFGLGQPRGLSRFPKKWFQMVWNAYSGDNEIEKKRLTELLLRLKENQVVRSLDSYDGGKSWLENAEIIHAKSAFRAIISKSNPQKRFDVLHPDELVDSSHLWAVPTSKVVPRVASEMAKIVAPVLSSAQEIIFVDPHFAPEAVRYRKTFEAFMKAIFSNRSAPIKRLEFHSEAKSTTEFFREECKKRLKRQIPQGVKVIFVRWENKDEGQALHNRYILTDLGGLAFQHGLDQGKRDGETDDVSIVARDSYELRWWQYSLSSQVFELAESPFELIG